MISDAVNLFASALAAIALLAFLIFGVAYARIESDTARKLLHAERIHGALNARRAAKYAEIVAACLNGRTISDGRRVISCKVER